MTSAGSGGSSLATSIVVVLIGVLMVSLGVWGWRNAGVLAPAALDEDERLLRSRMLRRGGVACCGAGGCLLLAVAVGVLQG